ncbi:MAG: hypothetical protein GWN62_12975, partial [Aliifodinibius sp.]|nr:hypothetical protein [Fodinibius sp.]
YKKFADTAKGKKIAERIKKAREQGRRIMKVYFREGEEAADSLFEVIYKSLP